MSSVSYIKQESLKKFNSRKICERTSDWPYWLCWRPMLTS